MHARPLHTRPLHTGPLHAGSFRTASPTVWTAAADARLRRLRAEGRTWAEIAADLGVSRDMATERGRRIGARRPPADHAPTPASGDPARPPLPPGHPVSWGLLTRGTTLEGVPYPFPVFA